MVKPAYTSIICKSIVALTILFLSGATAPLDAAQPCAGLYYDYTSVSGKRHSVGQIHSMLLQNLIGHFPAWTPKSRPVEDYRPGELDECPVNFYFGTYYDNKLPREFLDDARATPSTLVWMGYNTWQLGEAYLRKSAGISFAGLSKLDHATKDAGGFPGFYRMNRYRGEVFTKFAGWNPVDPNHLLAAWELNLFRVVDPAIAQVVATAEHSTDLSAEGHSRPWAIRNNGSGPRRWFLAESPFAFMEEDDRYLIMADLLFDMLGEPPRRPDGPRPAFIRIEDITPVMEPWLVREITRALREENVPFAMSTIPVFTDPLSSVSEVVEDSFVAMTARPAMAALLRESVQHGASVIFHGVTHQSGRQRNPFSGCSGDDFEFWDRVNNKPVAGDSPAFVINRLETGLKILRDSGLRPVAWLTPHYQASPLDYVLFGQLFRWNVGRVIYFPSRVVQAPAISPDMGMDRSGFWPAGARMELARDTAVEVAGGMLPNGQFFPYEIYRDTYGQRIIPENLGNLQPYLNHQVLKSRTVEQILASARRNLVLRDTWASFFVHPLMILSRAESGTGRFSGDTSQIRRLVREIKAMGYEFIDLREWIQNQTDNNGNEHEVSERYIATMR
jgi:uncharacterized protein YdaL